MLGRSQIEELIPHRPPILMLDRVTDFIPGEHGKGECYLAVDDPRFTGHFPDHPILPGAFIVEACGQLLAVVCRASADRTKWPRGSPIDYLASIERFKFLSPVRPGDLLAVNARVTRRVGGLLQARVFANVRGELTAEGILNVTTNGVA